MSFDLWAALGLGLVGSGHCLVMCGPLALALPRRGRQGVQLHLSRLVYNLGRTATYGSLGLLFGALGQSVAIAGLQRALSVGLGITLLGLAVARGHRGGQPPRWMSRLFARVQSQLGKQWARDQDDRNDQDDRDDRYGVTKPGLASPFGLGLLNGLLPCGLVWAALAAATALGSASQGALFMLVFGLGTIPTLFATATLGRLVGSRTRRRLAQAVPAALVVLGLLLVARGLLLPAYGSSHGHHKAPADNAVSHSAMSHSTPTGGAVS